MDAQSYTAQERRAANQVWAAAGAYGFEPLFLARYTDGTTDFYMNTVVGLIHTHLSLATHSGILSSYPSTAPSGTASSVLRMLLYQCIITFHGFGVVFQPRTFSAQGLSTSELLRTL